MPAFKQDHAQLKWNNPMDYTIAAVDRTLKLL